MKKLFTLFLILLTVTTSTSAIYIEDEEERKKFMEQHGNTDGVMMLKMTAVPTSISTLSENEQNKLNAISNKLNTTAKSKLDILSIKVKNSKHKEKLSQKIESKLFQITSKYPADSSMSSSDTNRYYILNYLLLQIKK